MTDQILPRKIMLQEQLQVPTMQMPIMLTTRAPTQTIIIMPISQ